MTSTNRLRCCDQNDFVAKFFKEFWSYTLWNYCSHLNIGHPSKGHLSSNHWFSGGELRTDSCWVGIWRIKVLPTNCTHFFVRRRNPWNSLATTCGPKVTQWWVWFECRNCDKSHVPQQLGDDKPSLEIPKAKQPQTYTTSTNGLAKVNKSKHHLSNLTKNYEGPFSVKFDIMWNVDVLSTLQESKVRVTRSFQGAKQTLHHMDWSPSSPIFFSTQVTGGPNVKVQRRVRAATKRGSAALALVDNVLSTCQQKSPCFFGSKNMHVANQVWLILTFMLYTCLLHALLEII